MYIYIYIYRVIFFRYPHIKSNDAVTRFIKGEKVFRLWYSCCLDVIYIYVYMCLFVRVCVCVWRERR